MTTQTTLAKQGITEQEAHAIGVEAYLYFYPLITMDMTRQQGINIEPGKKPGCGPMNSFHHMRAYPDADFKIVVRPNFDTLYSIAWLDLTQEPMIVSVPSTQGRYYLLPMLDMWTDVFAVPGWRTTGTEEHHFAVTPPGYAGTIPQSVVRIDATTPYVWIIGRTKTDGADDYAAVNAIQDGFKIRPLSHWGKMTTNVLQVKIDPAIDMKTPPLEQVNQMKATQYFARAAEMLKVHPPHRTDWSLIARLERLGLERGKSFDLEKLDAPLKKAVENACTDALKLMNESIAKMGRSVNGWLVNTETMGVYGNYYLKRALVAMVGLGANQPDDAVYPLVYVDADSKPFEGSSKYVLHFNKNEWPPAEAFWSITLYDEQGFQCANSLNRFALSSWMPFVKNADGSLDLYFQNENPGGDKHANWLPTPKGTFNLCMRLYAPRAEMLRGEWNPPAVRKVG